MFDSLFPKEWTTLQRLMWLKTNALARAVYEIVTGNPVSFSAIAAPLKQLSVAFSPVQDLNGYDSPWPAGGGKNKAELTDPELTVRATQRLATLDQTGTFNYVISFDLVNATFEGSSASLLNFVANNSNNYRTPGQIRRISDDAYLNGITQPVTGRFYTVFASLFVTSIGAVCAAATAASIWACKSDFGT